MAKRENLSEHEKIQREKEIYKRLMRGLEKGLKHVA